MNFRLTAVFFALVVAGFAALLLVFLLDDEKSTEGRRLVEPLVRSAIAEKDIESIELIRTEPAEERLLFAKSGNGQWEQINPKGRIDGTAIDGIVRAIYSANPIPYKALTDNLTLHGLDKPTLKVILKAGAGAGRELTINIGLTVIGDPAVTFVTTSANKRPIAVRRSDLAPLFRENATRSDGAAWETAKWLPEYRPRRLLMPLVEVQAFKLSQDGKELALTRDKSGAWKFATPANYGDADDLGDSAAQTPSSPFTGVRPLLDFVTSLQAGPEDYVEKPGDDLKKYGLAENDAGRFRIEVKGQPGSTETLFIGKQVEENGKAVVPTRFYAKRDGDSSIIRLNTDRTESLKQTIANPGEMRNKDVLPESRRTQIDAIDVMVGTGVVKLRRVTTGLGDRWVVYGDGKEPTEAKAGEVEAILTALCRPRAAREILATPNDAAFADTEKKATVKVWYDSTESQKVDPLKLPPEPKFKENAKPVELIFGKREGETVFVRKVIDGAKTDLKLADAVLGQVTKSRLDFLDAKFKSFNTQLVTKLTFNRGTETIELTHPQPLDPWKFSSSISKKGQTADAERASALTGLLAGLAPERVVAETPTPEDLKKWNLDPAAPRMKAVIAINDKTDTERVYLFGAETEDKRFVYAQQVGRPFVVFVSREILNRFLTDDLRDRTVYKLAPANMTKVTIQGWAALNKQVSGKQERMTYTLEKQAGMWKGTAPAGFVPDAEKVAALLEALASPRAGEYLPGKPEHGTDPTMNLDATVFEIVSEGGLKVILVLGKAAEGGKVFAASNVLPGETFTLDTTEIRKSTETPAALQKTK